MPDKPSQDSVTKPVPQSLNAARTKPVVPEEIGGSKGLEPTRYGDWERNGRCTDF
ncbi:MAG: succinate dehydrogenase assembly factor 4 [Methylococcales bacterium]